MNNILLVQTKFYWTLPHVRQTLGMTGNRERKKLYPAQPKNQHEFHILHEICDRTNKDEDFISCNGSESGIIIPGCEVNLHLLCLNSEEIFTDGTIKCYPKYFQQLYTIYMVQKWTLKSIALLSFAI